MLFAGPWVIGIAIDPCENKLYYTDSYKHSVSVVTLKTGKRKKIVNTGKLKPVGVALEQRER